MDTEMADASDVAELSSPPRTGITNGSVLPTPTQLMSREPSLPAKIKDQLTLESASSENDESSDDSEYRREVSRQPPLPYTSLPTGLSYDARMRFHTELNPPSQRSDFHPEDPRRILAIYKTLCHSGLYDDPVFKPKVSLVRNPLRRIPSRQATKDEVSLVHEEDHCAFLKATATMTEDDLVEVEKHFDSIYYNQSTYNAALLAAGSAIEATLAVAEGIDVKNAFAVIRPPGHHAECDRSMGFCHFDNAAVAVKVTRSRMPSIRKILILDWDVHHGNGIQQAFYDDPNVLYISIHVHENGRFYPAGDYGDHLHCGVHAGVGKNINIPWPCKGMGDADYMYAFQHIVMPVAFDFNPDLVIIAAGFDAARGDQLGGCFVTPECYAHMTHMLMSLAGGKIVACLEGGYNLDSISLSALAVTRTLMGEAPPRLPSTAATQKAVETVRMVIVHQQKYWRCLFPKDLSKDFDDIIEAEKLHDIVRNYQQNVLFNKHRMINLHIFRTPISKSFDNQVLATRNYHEDVPLLVIFHDPPEVVGRTDPVTGKMDLHDFTIADTLKSYISWAIDRGFGVIDVNVPKFLTGISDPNGPEEEELLKLNKATDDLALYLWENYIEPNETKKVVFLGVGDAYRAILHILNTRTWDNVQKYAGVVGFLSLSPLRTISENFMADFARHYFRSSYILISHTHPAWDPARKRFSRKWGNIRQSPHEGLSRMLREHRDEVRRFLLARAGLPPEEKSESEEEAIEVKGNNTEEVGDLKKAFGIGNSPMAERTIGALVAERVKAEGSPTSTLNPSPGATMVGKGRMGALRRQESGGGRGLGGINANGEEDSDTIMVAGGVVPDD